MSLAGSGQAAGVEQVAGDATDPAPPAPARLPQPTCSAQPTPPPQTRLLFIFKPRYPLPAALCTAAHTVQHSSACRGRPPPCAAAQSAACALLSPLHFIRAPHPCRARCPNVTQAQPAAVRLVWPGCRCGCQEAKKRFAPGMLPAAHHPILCCPQPTKAVLLQRSGSSQSRVAARGTSIKAPQRDEGTGGTCGRGVASKTGVGARVETGVQMRIASIQGGRAVRERRPGAAKGGRCCRYLRGA